MWRRSLARSTKTVTILDEILDSKRRELDSRVARVSEAEMARRAEAASDSPRGFRDALASGDAPVIIAEVKRRSPSKGVIRADFDPESCARAYAKGGAAALSVLTDEEYFGGQLDYLTRIREVVSLPLLRKDFLVDAYQVDEARAAGADAILLIAAALSPDALLGLHKRALELGLDVLLEVHDEAEFEFALSAGANLVGVNNRDLRTFVTDIAQTEKVLAHLPMREGLTIVSESGIKTGDDLKRLEDQGVDAALIGESLMRADDPGVALAKMLEPIRD